MNVRVHDEDTGTTVSYWGVTDFEATHDTVVLFWPMSADRKTEEQVRGRVLSGVDSKSMNERGKKESIEIDRRRDREVVVVPSACYPELEKYA